MTTRPDEMDVSAEQRVAAFLSNVARVRESLHQVIVGQDQIIDLLLICAINGHHALLQGVPGLAKTLMVKALAATFDWKFRRIQFTPDLMPADITGYELLASDETGRGRQAMVFRPGPVFANLVLADEVNRAAPKTQSALLEAMAELHVTVGGKTYPLEQPFLVVATQNPIEQEGTYPLPEAQLDRFMMEIRVGYPSTAEERQIVELTAAGQPPLPEPIMGRRQFMELRELVGSMPLPGSVVEYAVRLCAGSRPDSDHATAEVKRYVEWGAGPRGTQFLIAGAKVRALLQERTTPTFADVRAVALPVLRHRIIPNYQAVGDGVNATDIVTGLVEAVPE
ncbi:MAG: MoxR family ATPase [Candidatus Brocadiia bacterium]